MDASVGDGDRSAEALRGFEILLTCWGRCDVFDYNVMMQHVIQMEEKISYNRVMHKKQNNNAGWL